MGEPHLRDWDEARRLAVEALTPEQRKAAGRVIDQAFRAAGFELPSIEALHAAIDTAIVGPDGPAPMGAAEKLDEIAAALNVETCFRDLIARLSARRLSEAKIKRLLMHERRFMLVALIHKFGWEGDQALADFSDEDEADPRQMPTLLEACAIAAAFERSEGRPASASTMKKSYDLVRKNGPVLTLNPSDHVDRSDQLIQLLREAAPSTRGRPST